MRTATVLASRSPALLVVEAYQQNGYVIGGAAAMGQVSNVLGNLMLRQTLRARAGEQIQEMYDLRGN